MIVVNQSWDFMSGFVYQHVLSLIEDSGRTCYQSEPKGDPEGFVRKLIDKGHHSVLEHAHLSVSITTNRGVTHELVRHRLASYSQESTRYCKYNNNVRFIRPVWLSDKVLGQYKDLADVFSSRDFSHEEQCWLSMMQTTESVYRAMLEKHKWSPQQAREVLPNALASTIVMTANLREWRHIFSQRCPLVAHPQMRVLMRDMLQSFWKIYPVFFEDLYFDARLLDDMDRDQDEQQDKVFH